jgi:hypothetical protein
MEQPTAATPSAFEIEEEIGSGAIATVVRLRDTISGELYAGKILHDRHLRDPEANRRFSREAELTSTLVHENLVRVWGIRDLEGRPALLMELVPGPNLAEQLARTGPMDEASAVALVRGIAEGLSYAHARGVIHRDLKPANILLAPHRDGPPVPKIADFGMARASSFASADKGALTVLGTPQYMAPECLEPLAVDPRTDLYALGCILHEMATGAPPYGGATPFAVLDQHRNAPVPELPSHWSPAVRSLAKKLLAKAPGDRPQAAGAVVAALDDAGATALVPVGAHALAVPAAEAVADGGCARCGADVLPEVRLCFRCGLAQISLDRGDFSVFVVGPGRESDKLDSALRDRLLRWLRANAAVGLDPRPLERKIPRLPFPLLVGVSEPSARAVAASLRALQLESAWVRGGAMSHYRMMPKTNRLASRRMALPLAFLAAPAMVTPFALVGLLPLMLVTVVGVWGFSYVAAAKPAVATMSGRRSTLPPVIQRRLDAMAATVENIHERRHRDALRTVVHRVVELCRSTAGDPEIEAEMDHALALAAAATLRMDGLDQTMSRPDFNPADPAHRQLMHERDMWSARLLDLTATLDAFTARQANARALVRAAGDGDGLDELRATVEALEEVQRR